MADITTTGRRHLPVVLLLLIAAPTAVHADGISPILNFFHRDTWIPASIVTAVIILLEGRLLWRRIENLRFAGALWRSVVLNVASSLTGSALLIVFSRDSFFIWDTMSLVLPLFLITLATEIPLLHRMFRAVPLSWERAASLGFGINVASYFTVFLLEIGLSMGWMIYAGHLDRNDAAAWHHPELLDQATGLIYSYDDQGAEHGLRVYDPRQACWLTMPNCPAMDPIAWDVEGDLCAFVHRTEDGRQRQQLVVTRLPDFAEVLGVPLMSIPTPQSGAWHGVERMAISPDQKRVAILLRQRNAVAPRNRSSYFDLGSACRLIVIDLESGQEISRAPRWASGHDLCWLPGSDRVLFCSFDDESVYEIGMGQVRGDTSYGIGYARDDRFKRSVYVFDCAERTTMPFVTGGSPTLAVMSGRILFRDGDSLYRLDPAEMASEKVDIPRRIGRPAVVSPAGDMILAEIQRHVPLGLGGHLVLLNVSQPDVWHLIDDAYSCRVDWAAEQDGMSAYLWDAGRSR